MVSRTPRVLARHSAHSDKSCLSATIVTTDRHVIESIGSKVVVNHPEHITHSSGTWLHPDLQGHAPFPNDVISAEEEKSFRTDV